MAARFVLIHGICAGAWCWDLVVPHLEAAGHEVLAVDLPCDDPKATFTTYAEVVEEALGSDPDVILVGHSTGGLTIPLVAARRPVRELVFLCGAIPEPGKSVAERGVPWRAVDPSEWQVDNGDGSFSISPEGVAEHVAQDVDPAMAAEIAGRLRPQAVTPFLEPCPLDALPDVACRYVLCRDDHMVSPAWSRRAATELLGIKPTELPGSHSPMAGRPKQLADLLISDAHS